MRLAKKRHYWFNGIFRFAFCLSWADVFTLRNPLIRQPPKRYKQPYDDSANNKRQC